MPFVPLIERSPCKPNKPLKIAVFVSGHGSNLQALINDRKKSTCPYEISVVVSNHSSAFALQRAEHAKLKTVVVEHGNDREEFEKKLLAVCKQEEVELVVLAGFMRLLSKTFLDEYPNRVINLHPALNPAFPGLHAQRQALQAGVWYSGCTVHLVNEGVDTGAIIAQSVVPILLDDDEDALVHRIHAKEHKLLCTIVRAIAKGKVLIDGTRIRVLERNEMLSKKRE